MAEWNTLTVPQYELQLSDRVLVENVIGWFMTHWLVRASSDLTDEVCKAVLETSKAKIQASVVFKIKDTSVFLKLAFTKSIKDKMDPGKYRSYVVKVTTAVESKTFANLMAKVFTLPPSSAGIDRISSTAGLVQSNLQN